MNKKNLTIAVTIIVGILAFLNEQGFLPTGGVSTNGSIATQSSDNATRAIAAAYRAQRSDVQVRGEGVVKKVLRDDNEGSRHQRFLLKLDNGQTLLVAHNIDLAPRIANLQAGDSVGFYGEYEWNNQGGVLHWTHHDPRGKHPDGWLKHKGRTYE